MLQTATIATCSTYTSYLQTQEPSHSHSQSPSYRHHKQASTSTLCQPASSIPNLVDIFLRFQHLGSHPSLKTSITTPTMSTLTNATTIPSADSDPSSSSISTVPMSHIRAEDIALPPSPLPLDQQPDPQLSPSSHSPTSPTKESLVIRTTNPIQPSTPSRPRAGSPQRKMRPLSGSAIAGIPPPMQRAHSSPGVDSSGRYIHPYGTPRRPVSPLPSHRRRSPLRSTMEESYPGGSSWSGLNMEPNIPENEELELSELDLSHPSPISSYSNTFPRSRRRTNGPLHQSASAPSLHARAMSPGYAGRTSPSPSIAAQRFTNEPYPMYSFSSASSIPSTPTSLRSRSPSISSLETIEDSPDAEEAAMMEAEEAKVVLEDGEPRRTSLEVRGNNLRSNKERKRWSVCGAERRADFSLEPIEE